MANIAALQHSREFWKPASELHVIHQEPKFSSLELPAFRSIIQNGLSRGAIAEITGSRSTGRASACLHILAQATTRGEVCALIDSQDRFDPATAAAAGVQLERLIWVRCRGNAEHAVRAADLLLHAGGFGVVLLDFCELGQRILERVPLSYWYRFRRAVEHTPSILLVSSNSPQTKSCSTIRLELTSKRFCWSGQAPFLLLRGLVMEAMLRKPAAARATSLYIRRVA